MTLVDLCSVCQLCSQPPHTPALSHICTREHSPASGHRHTHAHNYTCTAPLAVMCAHIHTQSPAHARDNTYIATFTYMCIHVHTPVSLTVTHVSPGAQNCFHELHLGKENRGYGWHLLRMQPLFEGTAMSPTLAKEGVRGRGGACV